MKKNLKQLFETKLTEKITDPSNAKEYYNSSLKRKNTELAKRWKIITQHPKPFKSWNIGDIKSYTLRCYRCWYLKFF